MCLFVGKEKESKRSEYLKVLEKHQISHEQRTVMLSTRDIGQKLTLRNHLRLLFHKHKAGMRLSEEELALLFPQGVSSNDSKTELAWPSDDAELHSEKQQLTRSDSSTRDHLEVKGSKGIEPTPKNEEDPPTASSNLNAGLDESVGVRMLELIRQLKQKETASATNAASSSVIETSADDSLTPSERYVPQPLKIPIGIEGVIASASQPETNNFSGRDSVSVNSKYVKVERAPELQVTHPDCVTDAQSETDSIRLRE